MNTLRFISNCIMSAAGWQIDGEMPRPRKIVVIGGPHTSNWDFIVMCACALHLRVRANWIGKDALFRPPLGRLMRRLGGISVDRSKANDTVQQVVAHFSKVDDLVLVITPEGTRGKVRKWKSGFYWIAKGAGVPIVLFYADYERKVVGIGPTIYPTGNYDEDVAKMQAFFEGVTPRNPDRIAKSERE